jgi:hypothetical protein
MASSVLSICMALTYGIFPQIFSASLTIIGKNIGIQGVWNGRRISISIQNDY